MAQLHEHVKYLSDTVGPRPAGTSEEQQAALYLADTLNKNAGFFADIEEFPNTVNCVLARSICSGIIILAILLGLFVPILHIPAMVLTLLAAALYIAEAFERPVLTKLLPKGLSQNVVSKYDPHHLDASKLRSRKIVLVAHYDSGRVMPPFIKQIEAMDIPLPLICLGSVIASPLVLALAVFTSGVVSTIFKVLAVAICIVNLFPFVRGMAWKFGSLSQGANNNATGVAALLETAQYISEGRINEEESALYDQEAVHHGQEAIVNEGLVPKGAEFVYEASDIDVPDIPPASEEARLAAAKAAVAAFTGEPEKAREFTDIANQLVQIDERKSQIDREPIDSNVLLEEAHKAQEEKDIEEQEEERSALRGPAEQNRTAGMPTGDNFGVTLRSVASEVPKAVVENQPVAPVSKPTNEIPDWFTSAREKAHRPSVGMGKVKRSRFADLPMSNDPNTETEWESRVEEAVEKQAPQNISYDQQDSLNDINKDSSVSSYFKAAAEQNETQEQPVSVFHTVEPSSQEKTIDEQTQNIKEEVGSTEEAPREENEDALNDSSSYVQFDDIQEENSFVEEPQFLSDEPLEKLPQIAHTQRTLDLPSVENNEFEMPTKAATRKPMSEGQARAKALLTGLPAIENNKSSIVVPEITENEAQVRQTLRTTLPAVSGDTYSESMGRVQQSETVSSVGSFTVAGATSAFAPVGDELVADVEPDELYIDDADDYDFEESYTDSGAYAGPSVMEMPQTRGKKLLSKFQLGRKKDRPVSEELTPQEWLEVSDDFDARTVGKERGSWESFKSDQDDFDEPWQGGAFSRLRQREVENQDSGVSEAVDFDEEYSQFDSHDLINDYQDQEDSDSFSDIPSYEKQIEQEIGKIRYFHNPQFDTEVWFVGLGSNTESNEGMEAFLDEHEEELRGAVIIELDALGVNDLSLIENEGVFKQATVSSRMKTYLRRAEDKTGMKLNRANLRMRDGAASTALKRGLQAMHLAGMEDNGLAFDASSIDTLNNVDDEALERNTEFVIELVKNI